MKPFVKKQLLFIIMVTATLFSCLGYCQALDIAKENNSALGSIATIITESEEAKSVADVLLEFQQGGGYQSNVNYLTFGLNSDAQWLIVPIENHTQSSINKRVAIETSWLDSVDLYLYSDEKVLIQQHLGDNILSTQESLIAAISSWILIFPLKEVFFSLELNHLTPW